MLLYEKDYSRIIERIKPGTPQCRIPDHGTISTPRTSGEMHNIISTLRPDLIRLNEYEENGNLWYRGSK